MEGLFQFGRPELRDQDERRRVKKRGAASVLKKTSGLVTGWSTSRCSASPVSVETRGVRGIGGDVEGRVPQRRNRDAVVDIDRDLSEGR
jgi:hypothetical protein